MVLDLGVRVVAPVRPAALVMPDIDDAVVESSVVAPVGTEDVDP